MLDDSEPRFEHAAPASGTQASPYRYDVFLCHNMADKPVVKLVADALQIEAGILFFLDEFSIPASVEFMEFIREEMRRSAACAIFLGLSGWGPTHLAEARLALDVKTERPDFRIIPVNLNHQSPDWARLFGADHQPPYNWISMSGASDDEACTKLIDAVQGHFKVKASGPEAVTPYYVRRQAALWEKSGRSDNSILIGGKLLKEAQAQAGANPAFVSVNSVPAYLARCAQSERNRLRIWLGLAVAAFVIAGSLAIIATYQRNEAVRQREAAANNARISQVRSLAATAIRSIGEDRSDERALLLARQAYLLDERSSGQSSYLVAASLAEVLATPYLSSTVKLPDDAVADGISASGAYVLSGEDKRILTGPMIDDHGARGRPHSIEVDAARAAFIPKTDDLLVATRNGDLEIRKAVTPSVRSTLVASLGSVPNILLVSRNGARAVALTGDSDLIIIDIATGAASKPWKLHDKIESVAVSADAKFVGVRDSAGKLRVYSWQAAVPIAVYPGQDTVNSFDFVGTGNSLVVGERGGAVWAWDPGKNGGIRHRLDAGDPRGSVDAIAVSADGSTVATASGAITPGISLWRPNSLPASVGVIPGQRSIAKLAFTADNRFLISSLFSGETRYWRLTGTGTSRAVLARDWQPFPLPGRLYSVARYPLRDSFIIGGDHGALQKWDAPTLEGKPHVLAPQRAAVLARVDNQARYTGGGRNFLTTGHVMAVGFSRDGNRFATVDPYGFALVWRADAPEVEPILIQSPSIRNAAFSVALSPSGRRLAVGATSTVTYVHELDYAGASTTRIQVSSKGDMTVRALVFTDETHLLVGDDTGRLSRWSLGEEPSPAVLIQSGPPVTSLAAVGDDRIAVGRGDQVDLINPSKAPLASQPVSKGLATVYAVAVSDDRRSLAAGFGDGFVRIWSLSDLRKPPVSLKVHRDIVRSLAFDRSGDTIVSVGDDGVIRSSTIGSSKLADLACGLLWRDLDGSEVREFFGTVTPPSLPTCRDSASR
jgi:WD40 repeat protein